MDFSRLSQEDLRAIAAGDMGSVSDFGLQVLAGTAPAKKKGVLAALEGSGEGLLSQAVTGIESMFGDATQAGVKGRKRAEAMSARYEDETGLDRVVDKYNQSGLGAAGREALHQVPLLTAQLAPSLATAWGGARLGAAAGSPFGPYGTIGGALLGAGAASFVPQLGSNVERQVQEQQAAGQEPDVSMASAVPAAAGQAALDVGAEAFVIGRNLLGTMLGPKMQAALARATPEVAEKVAKQTLLQAAKSGALRAAGAEIPTEVAQQVLERAQAGLPLTSPDALKEYADTAWQVSPTMLMGVGSGVHGRAQAKAQVAEKEKAARIAAAQQAQQEAEQAATAPVPGAAPGETGSLFPTAAEPAAVDKDLFGAPVPPQPVSIPTPGEVADQHGELIDQIRRMEGAMNDQRAVIQAAQQKQDLPAVQAGIDRFRGMEQAMLQLREQLKALPPMPAPGAVDDKLDQAYKAAQTALQRASDAGDVDGTQRALNTLQRLQQAQPGLFTKRNLQGIAAVQQDWENRNLYGQPGVQQQLAEQEEAGAPPSTAPQLAQQHNEWLQRKGSELNDEQNAKDIAAMEAARMNTAVTDQGELFPPESSAGVKPAEQTMLAKRDTLVQQLQAARRAGDRKQVDVLLEQLRALKDTEPAMLRDRIATLQGAYRLAKAEGRDTAMIQRATAQAQARLQQIAGANLGSEATASMAPELAGTNMPAQLPPGQGAPAVSRTFTAANQPAVPGPAAAAAPQTIEQAAAAARAQDMQQMDLAPDAALQGTIFNTPEQFRTFLEGEALQEVRKEVGLGLQTLARAKAVVQPLVSRVGELKERISDMRKLLQRTKETGAQRIQMAQRAHDTAMSRLKALRAEVDKELKPAQKAVDAAEKQLDKARAKELALQQKVADHQNSFMPDVRAKAANDLALETLAAYNDGLRKMKEVRAQGMNTEAYIKEREAELEKLAKAAHDASVAQIDALRKQENPLARSVLAFQKQAQVLNDKLAKAQEEVSKAVDAAIAAHMALDEAKALIESSPERQQSLLQAKSEVLRTKKVLQLAENSTAGKTKKIENEIAALEGEKGMTEAVAAQPTREIEQKIQERTAQEQRAKEAEETAARAQKQEEAHAQRKAENEAMQRTADMPGAKVEHTGYDELRKRFDKTLARIKELKAAAVDETRSVTARNKSKHELKQAQADARYAAAALGENPELNDAARGALEEEIQQLQEKIDAKRAAVNEEGRAESTIRSRRKELSELRQRMTRLKQYQKGMQNRAKITPIGAEARAARAEELRQAPEAGERLQPRVVGPLVRKIGPGQGKVRQAGHPKGVTPNAAVAEGNKVAAASNTNQQVALQERLDRMEGVRERATAALNRAADAGDSAEVKRLSKGLKQLEAKEAALRKQLDEVIGEAPEPTGEYVENPLYEYPNPEEAPSIQRGEERSSTPVAAEVADAIHAGNIRDTLTGLAQTAQNPETRRLAGRVLPLLAKTKIVVDPNVKFKGQPVAGLYTPATNTITLHPDALTEEDTLHEALHAATDAVLLADPTTLTPEQARARRELESMQRAVAANPAFKGEQIPNVREFVAESMTNQQFRAKMDSTGAPLTLWDRFTNTLRRMFGLPPKSPTAKVGDLIDKIMTHSREISGSEAPSAAAQALADDIIARPKSLRERLGSNLGLALEMWGVDMRAPLIKALSAAGTKNAQQAEYFIRKADARMSHTYAALSYGPLRMTTDSKGFHIIEAGNGPSAKEIFAAVSEIPGDNAQAKMDLAQVYLTAKRAQSVGWDKLGFGTNVLAKRKAQAEAMMKEVNADPATKAALEKVSTLYQAYNKGLIEGLVQSGYLPKAKGAELLKNGDYVPFYRVQPNGAAELVMDETHTFQLGNIRTQPYLKELHGGDQQLMPLNESLVRNTMLLTDLMQRNLATKSVAYVMQDAGAPVGKMKIHPGKGSDNDSVLRFKQEPDPKNADDTGDRWVQLDTEGTALDGIPPDMINKSIEGSFAPIPHFLRFASFFGDILRSGVTRNPVYVARQLLRDPMAAAFTGGLDAGPMKAVARSVKEFANQMRDESPLAREMLKKGVIHSNVFTGDPDDMAKFAMQLAAGDQSAYHKFMAFWDKAAMEADSATRVQMYDSAIKQGASEMEAEMAAMEMMNFHKRGLSPTVQYASRLIPFFNAQIQGLNVLYKAATGKMSQQDRLQIKEKFYRRAMFLTAMTLMYAAAMDDDETYKNARPRDRYGNFFVPNPLGGEHFKIPIPFEVGVLFKAIPEATLDVLKGNFGDQEWQAIKQLLVNQIPGSSSLGMPQVAKPALEVMTNTNWFTGRAIETEGDRKLAPTERFSKNTSEMSKRMSEMLQDQPINALQLSPKQIEHLLNGYFGSLPVQTARYVNAIFAPLEDNTVAPASKMSDLPLLGSLFQPQYGGGAMDAMYAQAQAIEQAKATFDKMVKEGRASDALAFRENAIGMLASPQIAKNFTSQMTQLRNVEAALRRTVKDPEVLREKLDKLDEQRTKMSNTYLQAIDAIVK